MKVARSNIHQTADYLIELMRKLGGTELVEAVHHKLAATQSRTEAATVSYAGILSDGDKRRIRDRLVKRFPALGEIEYHADASLIAGLKIQYRDYQFENSLKRRLQTLKNAV